MAIRIVNNKKLEMTDDEYTMYQGICKSYDEGNTRGSDLFIDLFETDDNGIIVFLRPPSKRATSLEVFLFLTSLMTQQHLRVMYSQVEDMAKNMKSKLKEYEDKIAKLEKT
jgi:hypothetical protein